MSTGELFVMAACLLGQAFFAGIETGLISIHRMRLRHFVRRGERGAGILEGFLTQSDRLLGTTLVGTNLNMVILSVVAASVGARLLPRGGETVATALVAVVVLVFGEYLPKAWFHSRPLRRSQRFAGLLRISEIVLWPLSWLVVLLSRLVSPGVRRSFSRPAPFVTREDLKLLAREGEKDGVLSARERVMINRVIELSGKQAGEIMVPRKEMQVVAADCSVAAFCEAARASGYTRMPVRDESTGTFTGVINVFFVLSSGCPLDSDRRVGEFARPALFVPHTMPVDDILPRMRRARQPMCLVQDAHDEVAGLITTEDVLAEIVGAL